MMGAKKRRSSLGGASTGAKDQTRLKIEKMEAQREERRLEMLRRKKERAEEEQRNLDAGNPGDVDFIGMVRKWRQQHQDEAQDHAHSRVPPRICICVRKRPISDKERNRNDHDSVTCLHPQVWIHSAKLRVDGISKYLTHTPFRFDHAFDETISTQEVYKCSAQPLVHFVAKGTGGRATVFAYGQTGSGKTYTMSGIQQFVCDDLFQLLQKGTNVTVSFFEFYGGYIQDLLHERKRLKLLEDGKGEVVVTGLTEFEASHPADFLALVAAGNAARTTHATEGNDASSRSHAICQITLRDSKTKKLRGKLSLVDLAGSERGSDTKGHNAQRQTESGEINQALLALKECIRALGMNKLHKHVPYRSSKLTLLLKDCFTSEHARTTMIATVSPGSSATDHSLNTLRYADRIKQLKVDKSNSKKVHKKPVSPLRERKQASSLAAEKPTVTATPTKTTTPSRASRLPTPQRQARLPTPQRQTRLPTPQRPTRIPTPQRPGRSPRAPTPNRSPATASRSSSQRNHATPPRPSPIFAKTPPRPETPKERTTQSSPPETTVIPKQKEEATETKTTTLSRFEQEETMLNMHMSNIQKNAELLTEEGMLLQKVGKKDTPDTDMDGYISKLTTLLDQKTNMILQLQEHMRAVRSHLK